MKGIGDKLIGDAEHFAFEERIFNFVMLIAISMTAFGTIMDLYYGSNILIDLIFSVSWGLTYYFSRFKGCFYMASVVSVGVLIVAFIPYYWISCGGSNSVIPYYTIVFITIVSIIMSGYLRIVMVLFMLAVELLLICRDAYIIGTFEAIVRSNMNMLDQSIHLCIIMAAMAVLIIGYSNTYMKEKARSEAYAKTIEEQYHQQMYYMENLEELIYKLKSERHDFNNHLGVIYGLMEGGDTDKAGCYVTKLVKTAEEYQNIANIPYTMVRAMLNYKLSSVRESGIELKLNINVLEGLRLNEFDITVILANLLDNAVDACAKVDESNRYIELDIQYQPDYLIIRMKNPVNGEPILQDGKIRTSKTDAENHGFGLGNIEYLVNKHNGIMKIESQKGVFKLDIALLVDV